MKTPSNPIVVFGGTGFYGRRIVASLVEAGEPVRVVSRNEASARKVVGESPEVVERDITSPGDIDRALEGGRAVVLAVAAMTWKLARRRLQIERDGLLGIVARLPSAGIDRVVYLSGYDVRREYVEPLGLLPFAEPMLAVQEALATSDLNWTVLGCPPSYEIFFAMIRGGTMTVPGGGPPALPSIAPDDVGAIAARCVVRGDLGGRHLRLCGPGSLSFPEAAERIGKVWGRTVGFRKIPQLGIRIAGTLMRPFNPFLFQLSCAVKLLNAFPQEVAAKVPADHQLLRELFDYTPVTLEEEAERRISAAS